MRIHVRFETYGTLKNVPCVAAAYFFFYDGTPIVDSNGKYRDARGNVTVSDKFTPIYSAAVFDDFKLFIPYDELHLSTGVTNLQFRVAVYAEGNGVVIAESNAVTFTYTFTR